MAPLSDIQSFRAVNGIAGMNDALDAVLIFGAEWLVVLMVAALIGYVLVSWNTSHFEGRFENFIHVTVAAVLGFLTERFVGSTWIPA